MDDKYLKEKASAYTALSLFYSDDKKAWDTLSALKADYSLSFPSYTREFTSSLDEEARFNSIWRDVRASFESCRINYSVLPYEDEENSIHFLYLAGDESLINGKKLVFLGAVMPSLEARKDTYLCVKEAINNGYTIVAPFESGLGPYALSVAIKEGGKAVAVLPSNLTTCPNESLLELMEAIYNKGLLLSQFSPYTKREKWHMVLRNRFLSSFGDAFYLSEEKDGGPGWAVFDGALKKGKKCALSYSSASNVNFSWCRIRSEEGALVIKKPKEIKKLFTVSRKKREEGKKTPALDEKRARE